MCDSWFVGEEYVPLLRRADLRDGNNYHFNPMWYMPVILKNTAYIEIYIRCATVTPHSFLKENTKVSLVLRHYPFLDQRNTERNLYIAVSNTSYRILRTTAENNFIPLLKRSPSFIDATYYS